MATFIVLYRGPTSSIGASHEGWPEWFDRIGGSLVDIGSPMVGGQAVRPDGQVGPAADLNGYSLVRGESIDAVRELVASHPFLAGSGENTIEIFAVPGKDG